MSINSINSLNHEIYGKPFYSLILDLSENVNIYHIKYMKFQEFFAQIFSIFNLLYFIMLSLCNISIKVKMKLFLLQKFFEQNKENPFKNINQNSKDSKEENLEENVILKEGKKDEININNVNLEEKDSKKKKSKKFSVDFNKYFNPIKNKIYTSWNYAKFWLDKNKSQEKYNKIKEKFEIIEKKMDIVYILQKLEEIDLLKIILFNKHELNMMKIIPKKPLFDESIDKKINRYYKFVDNKK